jgi:hypothetical protein
MEAGVCSDAGDFDDDAIGSFDMSLAHAGPFCARGFMTSRNSSLCASSFDLALDLDFLSVLLGVGFEDEVDGPLTAVSNLGLLLGLGVGASLAPY